MTQLNEWIIDDFKSHLISTAEYVKSRHEIDSDYTSVNDSINQVWQIAVETFEEDCGVRIIQWGSEEEVLFGEIFDGYEDKIFEIVK